MSKINILEEILPDVFIISTDEIKDTRGSFKKLFNYNALEESHQEFRVMESFMTRSTRNVLRGMHYQAEKAAHTKLVYCLEGEVLDVVVDIRKESKYFNKPVSYNLEGKKNNGILIAKGYAHGFLTLSRDCLMMYFTSEVHCPELDKGINWNSIDYNWPIKNPILSSRDKNHPSINDV